MTIYKFETTIYPNTELGEKLANKDQKKWEEQGVFVKRKEDTQAIDLTLGYQFEVADAEIENADSN